MWINWNTSIQWLSFCGIVCISVHPEIYNELQYLIILDHKNMPPLSFKKLSSNLLISPNMYKLCST